MGEASGPGSLPVSMLIPLKVSYFRTALSGSQAATNTLVLERGVTSL